MKTRLKSRRGMMEASLRGSEDWNGEQLRGKISFMKGSRSDRGESGRKAYVSEGKECEISVRKRKFSHRKRNRNGTERGVRSNVGGLWGERLGVSLGEKGE